MNEQIIKAAEKLAHYPVCCGSAQPGSVRLDFGQTFQSTTGHWWVVDGPAMDRLKKLLSDNTDEEIDPLRAAFKVLEQQVVFKGSGPVAPVFDEFDWQVEAARGSWYVIEGDAFQEFCAALETFCAP